MRETFVRTRDRLAESQRRKNPGACDRGATDPILVIAAIAVSLVLLVGGGFAVQGLITNGQDSNAKGDLDKAAVAQESVVTAAEEVYIYDNHPDSEYRALEQPPVKGSAIGFEPTAGGRLIVDASVDADGDKNWIAVSHSRSGAAFMRTSESNAIYPVGSAQVYAAGSQSFPLEVVTIPETAKFPEGFGESDVAAMMAAIDDNVPYFVFADRGAAPGHGNPAAPGAGGGSGGEDGAGGGSGGGSADADPIVWDGPIPGGGLTGTSPTPTGGVQSNGNLGYDSLGQPYGLQLTEAGIDESGYLYANYDKGWDMNLPFDPTQEPFVSAMPMTSATFAGFTSRQPSFDAEVTEVRAFVGGQRIAISGEFWDILPRVGNEGIWGVQISAENVVLGAPVNDFLNAGVLQIRLETGDWQTFNFEGLADYNTQSGDRFRQDVDFYTTTVPQVTRLDLNGGTEGFQMRAQGPRFPQMVLPANGTYTPQGVWVTLENGTVFSADTVTNATFRVFESTFSSCNYCSSFEAERTRYELRMPITTFTFPGYVYDTDRLPLHQQLDGATITVLVGGVEYELDIHRGAGRGSTI